MSESSKTSSSGQSHRHHHHHHHRSKHRFSRNKKLLKKLIWPIAIIFFLFIILITFFPDIVDQIFHRENKEDGILVPKEDKFSQYDQQKTIHFNEWLMRG